MSQPVLLLDDGELDDIQELLEELNVSFARVRGGAIIQGQPQPSKLLIATPRRIDAVAATKVAEGEQPPLRVVVTEGDSVGMRDQLRRIGFDYLVRRPVHNEALRLLLLHCLYAGEERRDEPRVPVGFEVPVKTGIIPRRAILADLSSNGCRLLSPFPLEPGKRIKLQIPEALGTDAALSLTGRVVRMSLEDRRDEDNLYNSAVVFDELPDKKREQLTWVLEERAAGPPSLAYVEQSPTGDVQLGPLPLETIRAETTGGWREINRAAQLDPRAEPTDDAHESGASSSAASETPEPAAEPLSAPPEMAAPEPEMPDATEGLELEVQREAEAYEPETETPEATEPSEATEPPEEAAQDPEPTPAPTVVDAPSYDSLVAAQQEGASADSEQPEPAPESVATEPDEPPSFEPPPPSGDFDPVRTELKGLAAMLASSVRGEPPTSQPRPEPREGERDPGPGRSLAAGLRELARNLETAEPETLETPEQISASETPEQTSAPESEEVDIARPTPFFTFDEDTPAPDTVSTPSEPPSIAEEPAVQSGVEAEEPELATQDPNPMERRKDPRGAFDVKVPAFGSRALRVLVGRDISRGGMRVEHSPDLELGDRLHLAIYGEPGEEPFLVWATVVRDDGPRGMGLVFDEVHGELSERLDRLVGGLPAVESLHDDEASAMGTVMSEILAR